MDNDERLYIGHRSVECFISTRKQDELIAYYSMHILEDDLEDCSPLVREFLSKKIKENGGSVNIQLGM